MMKKIYMLFIVSISGLNLFGQQLQVPDGYSMVDTVSGDLDKDGINEFVAAYNTRKEKEGSFESVPRELIIYKKQQNTWTIWKRSGQALYGSRDGGVMGDPFGKIEIKKGTLLISQSGGSSWKWSHTDQYRCQDGEFYLIGYTSFAGKPCEYWEEVDFNLSTGKMIVKKEYEACENSGQSIYKRENEELFKKGIKITLEHRSEEEIMIETPRYGHKIYLAMEPE